MEFITRAQVNAMIEENEKGLDWIGAEEIEGKLYNIYTNRRTKQKYAVAQVRKVYIGFNDNEDDSAIETLIRIVENEGDCYAYWGVTGRTAHAILAEQLKELLPQYDFEIGYNYYCKVTKK